MNINKLLAKAFLIMSFISYITNMFMLYYKYVFEFNLILNMYILSNIFFIIYLLLNNIGEK